MSRPAVEGSLEVLERGRVEVLGLLPYSSNYTFLTKVGGGAEELLAVYKPQRGERPLWDFPSGSLAARELAAWLVSEASGWDLVPPTVLRDDAPMGPGSLQLFIDHDPDRHYFVLREERLHDFAVFVAFDAVINNADRKAGHVLEDSDGKLWAVDHGVSFHTEPKLRTVIWEFAGDALTDQVCAGLERLGAPADRVTLESELASVLTTDEVAATLARAAALLADGRFPVPGPDRPLPWPLI